MSSIWKLKRQIWNILESLKVGERRISYSPNFKLYLVSRESLELDLQTRCCVVNYMFTKASLNEFFLDTVFEREKPAKRQEYILVCGREIEALSSSKRNREKIQNLLGDMEGNVLDNANLSTNLLELRKELGMNRKFTFKLFLVEWISRIMYILYSIVNRCGRVIRDFEREAETRCNF